MQIKIITSKQEQKTKEPIITRSKPVSKNLQIKNNFKTRAKKWINQAKKELMNNNKKWNMKKMLFI